MEPSGRAEDPVKKSTSQPWDRPRAAYQEKEAGGRTRKCQDTPVEMFTGGSVQSEGVFTPQQKAFDVSGCIFRSQTSFVASFTLLGKSPQTAIAWRADTAAKSVGYFFTMARGG